MRKIAALVGAGAMLLSVAGPAFAAVPDIFSSSNSGNNTQNGAPTQCLGTGTATAYNNTTAVGWSVPTVGSQATSGLNTQTYAWDNTLGTGAAVAGTNATMTTFGWFQGVEANSLAVSGQNDQTAWRSNTAYTGSATAGTNVTTHGAWQTTAGAAADSGYNTQDGGSSWFSVNNTMGTGAAYSVVNATIGW